MLLVSLLGIISGINGCGVISNPTQLLSISAGVKESLGDVVVKDIKDTLPLKFKLLKKFKSLQ